MSDSSQVSANSYISVNHTIELVSCPIIGVSSDDFTKKTAVDH